MQKTTDDMIRELHTVVFGVPGTDEKGMAGKINDIDDKLTEVNGSVKTNTTWRKAFCWALGFMATFMGVFAGIYFG